MLSLKKDDMSLKISGNKSCSYDPNKLVNGFQTCPLPPPPLNEAPFPRIHLLVRVQYVFVDCGNLQHYSCLTSIFLYFLKIIFLGRRSFLDKNTTSLMPDANN